MASQPPTQTNVSHMDQNKIVHHYTDLCVAYIGKKKSAEKALALLRRLGISEEKKLKQSIFAILTGLLQSHLHNIINHHKHLSCFMQLHNTMTRGAWDSTNPQLVATHQISSKLILIFARKQTPKFLIFHTTVTLNASQGHLSWYQNVEHSVLYHHTKFERNWSVNVWKQANIKFLLQKFCSFLWILNGQDKMSMSFIIPTSLTSIQNSI